MSEAIKPTPLQVLQQSTHEATEAYAHGVISKELRDKAVKQAHDDYANTLNAGTPSGTSPAESESESFPADEAEE